MQNFNENSSENSSVWVLGDQLFPLEGHPLLDPAAPSGPGPGQARPRQVVMVESLARMRAGRPYHQKKLVLVLSAMRHYAAELQQAGWTVDYRAQSASFATGLQAHLEDYRPARLEVMAAAEWRARQVQQGLTARLGLPVEIGPNRHFLVEQVEPRHRPGGKLIMEHFYRAMRRHFGVLIEGDGQPTGGQWNYDQQNRRPYPRQGAPLPPPLPAFEPDAITREVMELVARSCPANPGSVEGFDLPVTRGQALAALADFIRHRLPRFGPYEDAMSQAAPTLFHSVLSPLLNIGLLEPLEVIQQAELAYRQDQAPLNSVEGFIRQVLGWREYMYWRYHQMMPGLHQANHWQARRRLPAFYYTGQTEMNCLRQVIGKVLATGYSHHIERLMVLSNFALLAGIEPGAVNNWFLECYLDAYDWVVTPNVIGMGLCADGGVVGTKPYIASAAYINKMSDYCGGCRYNPKQRTGPEACPFNFLYWDFLLKWEDRLRANPRMGPNVLGLKHLGPAERGQVQTEARQFLDDLS